MALGARAIAALLQAAPRLGRLTVEPADDVARAILAAEFPVYAEG